MDKFWIVCGGKNLDFVTDIVDRKDSPNIFRDLSEAQKIADSLTIECMEAHYVLEMVYVCKPRVEIERPTVTARN